MGNPARWFSQLYKSKGLVGESQPPSDNCKPLVGNELAASGAKLLWGNELAAGVIKRLNLESLKLKLYMVKKTPQPR